MNKINGIACVLGVGIAIFSYQKILEVPLDSRGSHPSCKLPHTLGLGRAPLSSYVSAGDALSTIPKEIEFKDFSELVQFLTQSFTYGEALQAEFDYEIKKGATLEDLSGDGGVYSRLLELREIREAVVAQTLLNVSNDFVKSGSKNPQYFKNYQERLRMAAMRFGLSPDVIDLALGDLTDDISDLGIYIEKCDTNAFGQTSWSKRDQTIQKIRSIRKPTQIRSKSSALAPPFLKNLIKKRTMISNLALVPQAQFMPNPNPSVGPLIYPDAGKPGNVTGYGYPKGVWSLSYDDGPGTKTSAQILDNLKSYGIHATYFVLSEKLLIQPEMSLRAMSEGHDVNSHSFTHAQIPKLDGAGRKKEIGGALEVFEKVLGFRPKLFRLPYGSGVSVTSVREMIKNENLIHVFWTVDTLDWQDKDPESIYQRTLLQMKNAGNKGIILFHDIHPQTVIASEKVMKFLKDPENKICTASVNDVVQYQNDLALGTPRGPICEMAP